LIMRHVYRRGLDLALEPLQVVSGRVTQLGVEIRERLVQQEHLGVAHQRAAQGDALALAPRELARVAIEVTGDAEQLRRPPYLLVDLFTRHAGRLEREGDVLEYGAVEIGRAH